MSESNCSKRYKEELVPKLVKQLGLLNRMQVPKLKKIVVNMGLGEAVQEPKLIEAGIYCVSQITGQKPIVTTAKKAISNFKLRQGVPIGCCVTLRSERMFEFFERLINFALPRVRDFKGVSPRAFDGCGNYTIGLKEQLVFLEVEYDKIVKTKGINISIVTSTKSDAESKALLEMLGMPFRK